MSRKSISPRRQPAWSWPSFTREKFADHPTARRWLPRPLPGNQHDLGIQVVADLFEMDGWRVIQLGSNVPADDLAQAVEFYDADLVALSVSLVTQLPALEETIAVVRKNQRGAAVKILVGGCGVMGAAELAKSKGADDYATNALEAVARGNALVGDTGEQYGRSISRFRPLHRYLNLEEIPLSRHERAVVAHDPQGTIYHVIRLLLVQPGNQLLAGVGDCRR